MDDVITAHAIRKAFRERTVLSELDLVVPRGALYGLVGPNGAGKSTLIKILCGLLPADGGEVRVLGWPVPSVRVQGQIGYMPQEPALYPDLSVVGNLRFFGALYDLGRRQRRRRIGEVLELVELEDRRRQKVGTLSGGMQRRASLAVSLLHKPRLLMLDEPTVGVEPRLRDTFWDHFGDLVKEDATMLISTHHMPEAERCSTVGLLAQGRLFREAAPGALLEETGTATFEEAFTVLTQEGVKP